MRHGKFVGALLAAALATSANATTKTFEYDDSGTTVASGSFTYATGSSGVLGYADLTAFSVTVAGVTYTLADVAGLTDYIHFAYDTSANVFAIDTNSCGFAGCGYQSSLSAIDSAGTFGFFFNGAPGAYQEYSSNTGGSFTTITISDAGDVPEPATWAMMVGGFGLVGTALRTRRRTTVSFA